MPDTQELLDRGYTVADIRRMCGSFRNLSPKARLSVLPQALLKSPALDNCNHP